MVVGIREAAVAREAQREIDVAILAGDAAVLVIADRQVLDDQLELAVDAVHFPNLLTVFRNVGLAVLGAVADFVHDRLERALADLAQKFAFLVEDLDMRRVELVSLGAAKQNARNRHPQVSVLVDCGRRRGIEPGSKYADLVAGRHDNFGGVRLERLTFRPWAAPLLLCARLHRAYERRCGHRHTDEKFHDIPPFGLVSTPVSLQVFFERSLRVFFVSVFSWCTCLRSDPYGRFFTEGHPTRAGFGCTRRHPRCRPSTRSPSRTA